MLALQSLLLNFLTAAIYYFKKFDSNLSGALNKVRANILLGCKLHMLGSFSMNPVLPYSP